MEGKPFGRYQLIELLGRGGMGEVWRAHDTAIDRIVALKMLLPSFAEDPDFEARFRREARAAARLDDPHVVPIYDVGEIDDRLYVTMRLITGTDLQTLLDEGALDPQRAVSLIDQVASALHSAHKVGLVHRDVKPSNVLIDENDFAYLIDFGIARGADDTRLTSANATIGTLAYMAPERFNSDEVHPSSDIYALACVLYQCLTGQQPFPGKTLEVILAGHMVTPPPKPSAHAAIPAAMDQVIATGMAKKPEDRYQSTIEMAAAAKEAVTAPIGRPPDVTQPVQPRPTNPAQPAWPTTPPPVHHAPWTTPPPAHFGSSHLHTPPPPKRSGSRRGLLVGAAVFAVTLAIVGAVALAVGLTQRDDGRRTTSPANAAGAADFTGAYRADFGPGTDLEDKPVPNAPATTNDWNIRSTCGASGCVATAVSASGNALVSNLTFDRLGNTWVAVALASADCGGATPSEVWVVYTLTPQSDGTLTGDSIRASSDGLCAAKRTMKMTRTGDADESKAADPAVLPPRVVTEAEGLRGDYRQTTRFTDGRVVPGQVLSANTYCLRTGDRCLSLFHDAAGVVTLIYADNKWTRNEQGTTTCAGGGTAQVTFTAEYPMPRAMDDPIAVLTGRGKQTVAPGGACTGGGDFEDTFERTGD